MRKKKGLKMKSDSPSCLRRPRAPCYIIGPLDKAIAYIHLDYHYKIHFTYSFILKL